MTFDEAKTQVMALSDAEALALRMSRLANRERASAGIVCWDALRFNDGRYPHHRLTFSDAIYTALAFVSGVCVNEWLVVGRIAHLILRSLPKFEERPLVRCTGDLWFTGMLGRITVYASERLPYEEWLAGGILPGIPDSKQCSRGMIQNFPVAFYAQLLTPPEVRGPQGAIDDLGPNVAAEPVEDVIEEEPYFQRLNDGHILL